MRNHKADDKWYGGTLKQVKGKGNPWSKNKGLLLQKGIFAALVVLGSEGIWC